MQSGKRFSGGTYFYYIGSDGIAIEAKDVPVAQDTVKEWFEAIGISSGSSSTENGKTVIRITIGDVTLDGIFYDTALAEEIKGYFPLAISAVGYGGREEITFTLAQ